METSPNPENQLEAYRDKMDGVLKGYLETYFEMPEIIEGPLVADPFTLFDDENDQRTFDELSPQEKDITVLLLMKHAGFRRIERVGLGDPKKTLPQDMGREGVFEELPVVERNRFKTPTEGFFIQQDVYDDGTMGWSLTREDTGEVDDEVMASIKST